MAIAMPFLFLPYNQPETAANQKTNYSTRQCHFLSTNREMSGSTLAGLPWQNE